MIDKRELLKRAVSKIRGDRLTSLYRICEGQKTVSTAKILVITEKLHEQDNEDARYLRVLYDNIDNDKGTIKAIDEHINNLKEIKQKLAGMLDEELDGNDNISSISNSGNLTNTCSGDNRNTF